MPIVNNKNPLTTKYIVVNDPEGYEPGVWGFNSLKDAKVAYTYFIGGREDVILAQVIERKKY